MLKLDKFVTNCLFEDPNWSGKLSEVSNKKKDDICFMWLTQNLRWCSEVFPYCHNYVDSYPSLVLDLYHVQEGCFTRKSILNAALYYKKQDPRLNLSLKHYEHDCLYSHASGYFKEQLFSMQPLAFEKWYRSKIYLYLEVMLSKLVLEAYHKELNNGEKNDRRK